MLVACASSCSDRRNIALSQTRCGHTLQRRTGRLGAVRGQLMGRCIIRTPPGLSRRSGAHHRSKPASVRSSSSSRSVLCGCWERGYTLVRPANSAPSTCLSPRQSGPDCGKMSLSVNGAVVFAAFDTYSSTVSWGAELMLPLPVPATSFVLDVEVLGVSNSKSTNAWVQVVGAKLLY
jgi:hypothetical protein